MLLVPTWTIAHLFLLLFICVASCYSHYMCFSEVLTPSPLICRWQVGGPSCYFTLPTTKYPTITIDPSIVSVIISLSHCCFWFTMLHVPWWGITPPIALCKWWNLFEIKNKGKKEKIESIQLFVLNFILFYFILFYFFHFSPPFSSLFFCWQSTMMQQNDLQNAIKMWDPVKCGTHFEVPHSCIKSDQFCKLLS